MGVLGPGPSDGFVEGVFRFRGPSGRLGHRQADLAQTAGADRDQQGFEGELPPFEVLDSRSDQLRAGEFVRDDGHPSALRNAATAAWTLARNVPGSMAG